MEAEQAAPAPGNETINSADAETLIVAFGDSLYAGYGLDQGDGFAPELQRALRAEGIDAYVHNAGVSGDTTAAGLRRVDFVLDNLPRKPDLVIVGLGGNDMLRGIEIEETQANMAAIVEKLDARGIDVMLTGMLAPPNLGKEYSETFNRIFPQVARRYDAGLYPFFLDGLIGRNDLFLPDGIHPTAEGIDLIVGKVAPVVQAELQEG